MAIQFDPTNKRIILDTSSVTAEEVYSRWVDWAASSDNLKYGEVISHVGGNELGGGLFIPNYIFLNNGWKVRPMESNHLLNIIGNLFVNGGGVPVVNTLGTYNVAIQYTVPVQAQGIATSGTSGPSASEVADEVMSRLLSNIINADIKKVNGTLVGGNGTESTPWGPSS